MNQKNSAFHHIAIRVADYEKSKKFYMDVLGATIDSEWQHWKGFMACMLRLPGGGIIEMLGSGKGNMPEDYGTVSGCFIHLAFQVDDVAETFQKALNYGAHPQGPIKVNDIPSRMEVGAVYGLSGETLEFLKPL